MTRTKLGKRQRRFLAGREQHLFQAEPCAWPMPVAFRVGFPSGLYATGCPASLTHTPGRFL